MAHSRSASTEPSPAPSCDEEPSTNTSTMARVTPATPGHPLTSAPAASGEPRCPGDASSSASQTGSAWASRSLGGPSAWHGPPGPCRLAGLLPDGSQAEAEPATVAESSGLDSMRLGWAGGPGSAGSWLGSNTQSGERGTVVPCSSSPSSSSSSAEPTVSRWATGPPGHGAPSAPPLLSEPLSPPRERGGPGTRSSPSSESPESSVSTIGDRGGDTGCRNPREGNVHSKDWDRLQLEWPPRDASGSGSPSRGRVLSEPPSSPRPCSAPGGCSTPSEECRSPESRKGRVGLESGPLGGCRDTGGSSGPSGEPGEQEALAGGVLGGPRCSAAASGEPGGQVALGGSLGVPRGLVVSGDPSPGVWGDPGARDAPRWGSAAEEGAPGAGREALARGRAGDWGEPGARVGEPGARSCRGASGEPGAGAEGSVGCNGAPGAGAGQAGDRGEPGGPKTPSWTEESCGESRGGHVTR